LFGHVDEFMKTGFASFQAEWNSLDAFLGQVIEVQLGNQRTVGEMLGVNEFGELRVLTEQGQEVLREGEILPSVRRLSVYGEHS
jgi:biotin-(acetyl-CoA carboxylase) ligase